MSALEIMEKEDGTYLSIQGARYSAMILLGKSEMVKKAIREAAAELAQLRAELDEARKIIHATKDSLAVRLAVSPETWASFDEDELKACDAWLSAHPEETK